MMPIVTTRPVTGPRLPPDAGLPEVIEAVNELSAAVADRLAVSTSRPLHSAHPSASIVYTDEAYDSLTARPAPNEQLKRRMSGAPLPNE